MPIVSLAILTSFIITRPFDYSSSLRRQSGARLIPSQLDPVLALLFAYAKVYLTSTKVKKILFDRYQQNLCVSNFNVEQAALSTANISAGTWKFINYTITMIVYLPVYKNDNVVQLSRSFAITNLFAINQRIINRY